MKNANSKNFSLISTVILIFALAVPQTAAAHWLVRWTPTARQNASPKEADNARVDQSEASADPPGPTQFHKLQPAPRS